MNVQNKVVKNCPKKFLQFYKNIWFPVKGSLLAKIFMYAKGYFLSTIKSSKTFIFVLLFYVRYFHVKWNQLNPLLLLFNLYIPYVTAIVRFFWIHHRRFLGCLIVFTSVYSLFTVVSFNRCLEVEQLAVLLYHISSKNKIITCRVPDYQFHFTLLK